MIVQTSKTDGDGDIPGDENYFNGYNFIVSLSAMSSSLHRFNGDRKLSRFQQGLYFLLNWANNQFPYQWLDPKLAIRDFVCDALQTYYHRLIPKSSPSRRLCDLFWLQLPWREIKEELKEIHILDMGCGNGNYGLRLLDYSQGLISSYTGIDHQRNENWSLLASQPLFRFYQSTGNEIESYIPSGTNFFMSQSAIEHLDDDLRYFEQIQQYLLSYRKSVIQVHLFPASACLWLYGLHGVRQYTPRTVSKITRLFKDFSYSTLYRLGGKSCNRLHHHFITRPLLFKDKDWREAKTEIYEKLMRQAIERDMRQPQHSPSFYALVIHSYWRKAIFS